MRVLLIATALLGACAAFAASQGEKISLANYTFGVGFGQGFGGAGIKFETPAIAPNMTLAAAIGEDMPNLGLKYYLPVDKHPEGRNYAVLRLGVQGTYTYGVNYPPNSVEKTKRFTGFSVGVGRRFSLWEVEAGIRPEPSGFDSATYGEDWEQLYLSVGMNFEP